MIMRCINLHLHSPSIGVVIISGTERNGGTYNFRNGTELCFGFYKNIISGTERSGTAELSFRILPENDNLRNGTERNDGIIAEF